MSAERDRLDEIIDRSAARLVAVEPDAGLVERIVHQLPERETPARRVMLTWLPQCAAVAAVIVAIVIWNRERPDSDATNIPQTGPWAFVLLPASIDAVEPTVTASPQVVTLGRPVARPAMPDTGLLDHERSLAFVERPDFLALPSIGAPSLEPEDALMLAPLVLTELPLSGEPSSPR